MLVVNRRDLDEKCISPVISVIVTSVYVVLHYGPPKYGYLPSTLHGVITQEAAICIFTAMKTSDLSTEQISQDNKLFITLKKYFLPSYRIHCLLFHSTSCWALQRAIPPVYSGHRWLFSREGGVV
jgi:hypothetical protein